MKDKNGLFRKIEFWILTGACGLVITIPPIAGICNNSDSSRNNAEKIEEKIGKVQAHYQSRIQNQAQEQEPVKQYQRQEAVKQYQRQEAVKQYQRQEAVKQYQEQEPVKQYQRQEAVKQYQRQEAVKQYPAQPPIQIQDQSEYQVIKNRIRGLMFREARGKESTDIERIAIGFSPINRIKKNKKKYGKTIDEAIFKKRQYPTKKMDIDTRLEREMWNKCGELAEGILTGKYKDPLGATHYHAWYVNPDWAEAPNMIPCEDKYGNRIIGQHYFYEEM